MLRLPLRARKSGLVSGIAMAMALAGGAVVATAVTPTEAHAQDYSKKFREVYGQAAEHATADTPDWNAAKALVPQLVAAAENADEKYAAGQIILQVGNGLEDPSLQRQGLQMSIASGKVPAEQLGLFNWYAGNLAFQEEDYADARKYLEGAVAAGYRDNDPTTLIADTYMQEGDYEGGLNYLKGAVTAQMEAGGPVNEGLLLLGLKTAYENEMPEQALDFSTMLVANNPSQQNWLYATQTVNATYTFEPQAQLDLLRLQRETGSLKERYEYYEYAETAGVQKMGSEVAELIDEGIAAGVLDTGDSLYADGYAEAKRRGAMDREETPGLVSEARAESNGTLAMGVGDAFFSYGAYAEAEDMYSTALEKGVQNPMMVTTRIGIAQSRQGKLAEARETFAGITGPREPIARLWIAWIDSKM